MEKKGSIIGWLEQVEQIEAFLVAKLTAEQRNIPGTIDRWPPKVIIAHSALWLERFLENIKQGLQGKQITRYKNYLEINDQDYEYLAKLSWEEALEKSQSSREAVRDMLDNLSELDLDREDLIPSENPRILWQGFLGNAIEHPIFHLAELAELTGDSAVFLSLQERIFNEMIHLDSGNTEWEGSIRYNLACLYALNGQKESAIQSLRRSLELFPGLAEWSKEDPDLASIRTEREYLELYS